MENEVFHPAILYVDDEPVNLDTFRRAFSSHYQIKTCSSGEEALKILETEDFPLIVADQKMPGMSGVELCEKLIQAKPDSMRIILTAFTETQMLLDAIRRGHVHDYIVKPWRKAELMPVFEKAFESYKNRMEKIRELQLRASKAERLEEDLLKITDTEAVVGAGSGLSDVVKTIEKAAPSDSTILLLGETGTGKEVLARLIHSRSKRSGGPFVPVHCAAMVHNLLESELFGHIKGAFTGAEQNRTGRFELAKGGTIFLDEIAEIPMEGQVKLLRVLQERVIEKVGDSKSIPVDVRVLAATHANLEQKVKEGKFREDLFYRLNVITIRVPPLRERLNDIASLAEYFFEKFRSRTGSKLTLPRKTIDYLRRYDWPGNVRELENILERAVILSVGPTVEPEDLNLHLEDLLTIETVDPQKLSQPIPFRDVIHQKEVQELARVLAQAKGNIAEAGRLMDLPRTTMFNRLKKNKLI